MRQEFSVYDLTTGRIISAMMAFSDEDRDANVPAGHGWIAGWYEPSRYYVSDGAAVTYPPRSASHLTFDYAAKVWVDARGTADLVAARSAAKAKLNNYVANKRRMIVTDLPGQDMIYLRKEEEGKEYLSLPTEPKTLAGFPLIAAEVGITAPTAYQVATIWVMLGSMWVNIAAQLEHLRLSLGAQIESASTFAEIEAIVAMIETLP